MYVLENALEKLSEGLKLRKFPGGACPQTLLASLHLLTFSPAAQKHLPTPLYIAMCSYYHHVQVYTWVFISLRVAIVTASISSGTFFEA